MFGSVRMFGTLVAAAVVLTMVTAGCGEQESLEEREAQALEDARSHLNTQIQPNGRPLDDGLVEFLIPAAAYGFVLAPFLRADLTEEQLVILDMAGFALGGTLPHPAQINRALLRAGGPTEHFTPAQAELAVKLRDPESNGFVFRALTEPVILRLSREIRGPLMSYYQREFDVFQEGRPAESFLEAIIDGTVPDGFNELPGFEDRP